jgi:Leucine-rich repeat (LRR) protein
MKRILLILSAVFCFASTHAQTYLQDGDVVTISYNMDAWGNPVLDNWGYKYMEASTSGISTKDDVTDDCLWVIKITDNGQYYFQDLTTKKYLKINHNGACEGNMLLVDESNASFQSDSVISGSRFYAFYPYDNHNGNDNTEDGIIQHWLDFQTTYKEGSFYRQCPIIAKSDNNNFEFKQTCGIIRFSISGSHTIEKLILKTNNGEWISGRGCIDIYSDMPIFTIMEGYGCDFIEMSVNKKLLPDESTSFYFIVPITKIESGITLKIIGKTEDGESFSVNKSTTKCIDISRGVIKSFNVVDTDELIEDYQATIYSKLMAFYNATNGDNWTNNTNWGSDKPFKEWYGITADDIFISEIDLSGNNLIGTISGELNGLSNLISINVQTNLLTSIKINSCPHLERITCVNNQLTQIDLSNNPRFKDIDCTDNFITTLKIANCPQLWDVTCQNNLLTELDLSGCPNLEQLDLFMNKISQIDILGCTKLRYLVLDNNLLTELSISGFKDLGVFSCRGNLLRNLIVSDCESLGQLLCDFNELNLLSIENCPNIETLWCHQNQLEVLDVTSLTKLKNLWCGNNDNFGGNALATLDLSQNTLLEEFSCYGMKLTSLDVSNNSRLWKFECSGNPIENLNLNNLSELKELYCHTANLSELDVSNNSKLERLDCMQNPNLGKIYIASSEQRFDYKKDPETKFCIKGEDELYDDFPYYISTDYTKDGNITILQQATIGKGINIVLMGDAFSDRLIADGTYDKTMKFAMEKFFSIEPYTSFRNYFNVYAVDVVSKNECIAINTSTALSTSVCDGVVQGDNELVFSYAQKAIAAEDIEDAVIIVIMNDTYNENVGTCHLYLPESDINDYGIGASISYFPLGTDETMFGWVLQHEAGGHGFAKLADEYTSWSDMTNPPQEIIDEIRTFSSYGWNKNVDLVNNPLTIKWSKFLSDARYKNEDIGIFEGAYYYLYGIYRPTFNSLMSNLAFGLNAPSREAIYYRIHKLAYGDNWEYDYEKFVEYDAINRNATATRAVTNLRQMPPLHEPVIIQDSWKNAKSNVPSRSMVPLNNNAKKQEISSNGNALLMKSAISHKITLPDGRIVNATHML